ncbi:MAG: hypothetical protein M5U27_04735 [Gaiella sp.]|nr:hypothetical protein [Gaiella sp.]
MRVGVDSESHAHEHALQAGSGGEPHLVGRVEHDRGPDRGGPEQKPLVLVVAVDDELGAVHACPAREGELALGGDVGTDAFLSQHPEQRDVGERLRPEEDTAVAAQRSSQGACALAERLLADDEERCAVLLGEQLGGHAADL